MALASRALWFSVFTLCTTVASSSFSCRCCFPSKWKKKIKYDFGAFARTYKRTRVGSISDIRLICSSTVSEVSKHLCVERPFRQINSSSDDTRGIVKNVFTWNREPVIVSLASLFLPFDSSWWARENEEFQYFEKTFRSYLFDTKFYSFIMSLLAWGSVSFRGFVQLQLMIVIHVSSKRCRWMQQRSIKIQLCMLFSRKRIDLYWMRENIFWVRACKYNNNHFLYSLCSDQHTGITKNLKKKWENKKKTMMMSAPVLFRFSIDSCFSLKRK